MSSVVNIAPRLILESALWYARERGWYVFPTHGIVNSNCTCGRGLACHAPGKHPRTAHGYSDASIDPRQIEEWFRKWPDSGIGIATGLSDLVVVDIDPRNRGDQTLSTLPPIPPTPRVLTGGGGWHYYLKKPPGGKFPSGVLAQGIDLKSDGGYVLAPPSIHIQGQYRSDPDFPLDGIDPAPLPDWIADRRSQQPSFEKSKSRVSDGLLGAAFAEAGMLGRALGTDKAAAQCPWEAEHTSGKRFDSSTIIYAPNADQKLGCFWCSHSHCSERTPRQCFNQLPSESVARAKKRLGFDDNYIPAEQEQPTSFPTAEWANSLAFDEKGKLVKDPGNVSLLLANADAWSGCLAYDEFRNNVIWIREPEVVDGILTPGSGEFHENDVTYIRHKLRLDHHVSFPKDAVFDAVVPAAKRNPFHPVRAFISSLEWDNIPRVDRWLATYLGAKDTPYTRLVSKWFLIGCIARVFDPGCKSDCMMILEGPQGTGKSTALRILGGQWFSDTPIDIGNKDAFLAMRGYWIIEFPELDSFDRSAASRAKAFLSSPIDIYREPYGRTTKEWPRQCIFAGTVNHYEYLQDESGARRFLPVECGKIKTDDLRRDREQLLAEALHMFQSGQKWWTISAEDIALCQTEQSGRYVADTWEDVIKVWIDTHSELHEFSVGAVLTDCLGFLPRDYTRAHETRVGKCLKRIGLVQFRTTAKRVWRRPLSALMTP
jgi:predicted P-loop ATPase